MVIAILYDTVELAELSPSTLYETAYSRQVSLPMVPDGFCHTEAEFRHIVVLSRSSRKFNEPLSGMKRITCSFHFGRTKIHEHVAALDRSGRNETLISGWEFELVPADA